MTPTPPPSADPALPPDPRSFRPAPPINTAGSVAQPPSAPGGGDQDTQDQGARYQGSVFPPSTFIPDNSPRGPSLWGKDHWPIVAATMYPGQGPTNDVPSPPEAYSVMGQYGSQLARVGSPAVAGLAQSVSSGAMSFAPILDMLSKGAFTQNYNASSLNALKIKQQRMLIESEEMQRRHAQELMGYGEIIAGTKAGMDPHMAEQKLHDLAIQNNHQWLAAAIEKGGLAGAINFLNYEDTLFRNIWAGTTSLKKATGADDDEDTLSQWGEDRATALGGRGQGGGIFGPASDTGHTAARGPEDVETPAGDDFAGVSKKLRLTPQEQEAVREQVATGAPSAGMAALEKGRDTAGKEFLKNKVAQGVDATEHAIDKIIDDPNMDLKTKISKIIGYSPSQASQLAGLRRYELDPHDQSIANRTRMTDRARRLFGAGFSDANYKAIQEFKSPDKPENRTINRASGMAQAALRVFGTLNETGENESIPERTIQNFIAHHLDPEDARWAKIYDALQAFDMQFQGLQSGTGTPRVGPMMAWLANIKGTASPAQIRGAVMQNIADAFQTVNTQELNWEKLIGRNDQLIPGIDAHSYEVLRAIVRMDTDTGIMPSDAPREVLSVSRKPEEVGKAFKGHDAPLTMKEIREDFVPRITAWMNSPDPAKRAAAIAANRQLGNVIGIERMIPEVDDDNANVRR